MNSKFLTYKPYEQSAPVLLFATLAALELPGPSFFAYSVYNMFSSLNYNESLEKEIKVKLEGEDQARVVKCMPTYIDTLSPIFDSCIFIVISKIISSYFNNIKEALNIKFETTHPQSEETQHVLKYLNTNLSEIRQMVLSESLTNDNVVKMTLFFGLNYKNIINSAKEKEVFEFTDINTGKKISYDAMVDAEFLGYHYNDVVSDSDVSNEVEFSNEINESCVLNVQEPLITILSS